MNVIKGLAFLFGTFWLAWVAYVALSVPTDVDQFMNEPMEALDGSSIGQEIKKAQSDARQRQCETYQDLLARAWDRAVENNNLERDADKIAELERDVKRFCD